jgi:hypothetical protein
MTNIWSDCLLQLRSPWAWHHVFADKCTLFMHALCAHSARGALWFKLKHLGWP